VSLDLALGLAGVAAETLLIAILALKRTYRTLPVFSFYVVWMVVSDVAMMWVISRSPAHYLRAFLIEMPLDSFFQFCVLSELAWSVFRPIRASLPRWSVLVLPALILLTGVIVWPIAGKLALPGYSSQWHLMFQLQQTVSILRILVFFVLMALSQILAIGWRDRELQIATGLGFYSLMSLGAAIVHSRPASPAFYHSIDQIVIASYLLSLLYWTVSFLQKEAPRQEFSPKMQSILLSVAGNARASRAALEEMGKSKR
jgi:hypothetical protein